MLDAYKKKYHTNNFQYILVETSGKVIETDNDIISLTKDDLIQNVHPFFESCINLLRIKNENLTFSCVNLNFVKKSIIADVQFSTNFNNKRVIVIENLTKHYNNYQLTAQTRNESIINSQIIELKNSYLKEKEQFKNNFIANFSHQLRNPITASAIFSRFLRDTNLNAEQKNYIDVILSANSDLKHRIDDILEIAKIESGKLILKEKVFSLKVLLNTIFSGFKILALKKEIDFDMYLDEKLPEYLKGDQYRLKQIIGNLLNNALNFTPKGSIKLHVSLNFIRAHKANLHIEVSDTGIGIAKEHQAIIFDRFFKIESEIQNTKRIGLGLYIVKYLVSEMNGNLKIESHLNQGTKFICNLSLRLPRAWEIEPINNNKKYPELDGKKHILLIEDSELIQISILKILSANGNFYLDIISNGEDLIPTVTNKKVDLILVSNTIQHHTPEALAKSIRRISKEYKKLPILALSSQVFKEDIKRLKKNGINDVISKPFNKENLLDKIYKYVK
jgi:signal transduction histidine kinase/BarA-like signal transduction histidine kinase